MAGRKADSLPRPMRVMFVTTTMGVGGQEVLAAEILRRLDRERFHPELCCLKWAGRLGRELSEEIPCFSELLCGRRDVGVILRLTRLLRRRRIDAVVTVGSGGDRMFWGRLAARWAGVPVIISAMHASVRPRPIEWLNRRLHPLTDVFIATGEAHARHLVSVERCPAERVRVVPNGVDTERFHPGPADADLRAELGLPQGAPVAGIVARMRKEKNHERFVRMAADVQRALPAVRFLVSGDGPDRGRLQDLAHRLGVAEHVRFCGMRDDVPALLRLIDVIVLTSDSETGPLVLLEAMAAERPVVATRVGSVSDIVRDGENGYLVDPQDETLLARRVAELLADVERARSMGRRGRESVLQRFSLVDTVRAYEDLLIGTWRKKTGRTSGRADPTSGTEAEGHIVSPGEWAGRG